MIYISICSCEKRQTGRNSFFRLTASLLSDQMFFFKALKRFSIRRPRSSDGKTEECSANLAERTLHLIPPIKRFSIFSAHPWHSPLWRNSNSKLLFGSVSLSLSLQNGHFLNFRLSLHWMVQSTSLAHDSKSKLMIGQPMKMFAVESGSLCVYEGSPLETTGYYKANPLKRVNSKSASC